MIIHKSIYLATILLILNGCSNTRFLTDEQLLYTGQTRIEIVNELEDVKYKSLRQYLFAEPPQKPNNSLLDRRILPPIGLWVYNYWDVDKDKKFAGWLHKTLSKPPVLVSDIKPELRANKIQNDLFDQGYFQARAWAVVDTSSKNPKKAKASYFIEIAPPYLYHQIVFDSMKLTIDSSIVLDEFKNQVEPGDQFNLEKLANARTELALQVQDLGYYYFNQDFIELNADTALGSSQLDLEIKRKDGLPQSVLAKYYLDTISVHISSPSDTTDKLMEGEWYNGILIFSPGEYIKAGVIRDAIYFNSGDHYTYSSYQNTLSRLNNLGVFSYVRTSYEVTGDSSSHLLNVRIDLVMADHINLTVGADMVTKSTGYSGPVVAIGLSHGNTFKGAEKVSLALKGGFEWQWGQKEDYQLGTISYEFGVNAGITFPKLLLPGNRPNIKTLKKQETSINQNFNVLNRTAYYSMFSSSTNLKYNWSNTQEIVHSFSPVYINSVNVLATTPAFDSVINDNIYIRKSFEEQFIVGMKYDFSYDNTHKSQLQNIYFQTGLSTSGNLLDLFAGMGKEQSERPFKIMNTIYSQYVKFTTDFRYYLNGFNKTLAMRLYAGVGIPYLNSDVLPYVEQFFSGGAYSIRGFTARTVGPGSFYEQNSTYIDQSGDLKLEANLEYRFGISKTLKGALFVETGNIWLINEDENRPGSKFELNTFHSQLAVGAGVGLRFDFNFFVLRTDFGVPIRTPYLQESGKNWLPGNRVLSEGLFYLAIGYPF